MHTRDTFEEELSYSELHPPADQDSGRYMMSHENSRIAPTPPKPDNSSAIHAATKPTEAALVMSDGGWKPSILETLMSEDPWPSSSIGFDEGSYLTRIIARTLEADQQRVQSTCHLSTSASRVLRELKVRPSLYFEKGRVGDLSCYPTFNTQVHLPLGRTSSHSGTESCMSPTVMCPKTYIRTFGEQTTLTQADLNAFDRALEDRDCELLIGRLSKIIRASICESLEQISRQHQEEPHVSSAIRKGLVQIAKSLKVNSEDRSRISWERATILKYDPGNPLDHVTSHLRRWLEGDNGKQAVTRLIRPICHLAERHSFRTALASGSFEILPQRIQDVYRGGHEDDETKFRDGREYIMSIRPIDDQDDAEPKYCNFENPFDWEIPGDDAREKLVWFHSGPSKRCMGLDRVELDESGDLTRKASRFNLVLVCYGDEPSIAEI